MRNLKFKNKTKKLFVLAGIILIVSSLFYFARTEREAKVLFMGDMFFDRQIRKVMYNKGNSHPFSCISDFLKSADLAVGNLEGPITENASRSLFTTPGSPENFIFTFPTVTAEVLSENNVKIVTLGNNHIGNFGKSGIESTRKHLESAGVKYFGGLRGDEPVISEKIGGQKWSFIAYNEFGGDSKEKVSEKIKEEKGKGDKVVVFTHWGEEYLPAPQRVKDAAKLFAQSGADMVIGSHPHVIQNSEKIKVEREGEQIEVPVYYSLGNFIFDQYWDKEVSTGLLLELNIKGDDISIIEHKVSINKDGTTCLIN